MSFSIFYEPNLPEYEFKDLLIRTGFATRVVYYINGKVREIPWKIGRLDRNSNLIANIRSYHEFRGPDARSIEKIIIRAEMTQNHLENNTLKKEISTLNDHELNTLLYFGIEIKQYSESVGETFESELQKCKKIYLKMHQNNSQWKGKAIRKIRKWAYSPNQENHKMIKAYFIAYDRFEEPPLKKYIFTLCSDINKPDLYVKNCLSTYNSLKIDGPTTNGKVFEDDGNTVIIWEYVKTELEKYKNNFLGNTLSYINDSEKDDEYFLNDEWDESFYDDEEDDYILPDNDDDLGEDSFNI